MVTENMEKRNIIPKQEDLQRKVKYPYRKCLKVDTMYALLAIIIFPILLLLEDISDSLYRLASLILFLALLVLYIIVHLSVLWEYLDEKCGKVSTDVVLFYEIDHFYHYLDQEPVAQLYPSLFMVRRMELKCKSTTKYYCFGIRKRYVIRCVGSYRKERALYSVFFPKEGRYVRRKESHPFKVTYTKYNKSLIRLDMVEGEEYPEGFTAKLEKINSMF